MQAAKPIRAGIIGFGVSGSVFHAPTISALDDFDLTAIVSDQPRHLALAEQRHPAATRWNDIDEFLAAAPALVDVVTVSVTNDLHYPLAARLIDLGVPVVVEKPLANTADRADDLVARAAAKAAFLTCFQNRRWDGDFLTVKTLIDQGRLGRVTRMVSRFEWPGLDVADGWREDPAPGLAGGALFDLGTHLVDQAVQLFGPVVEVYAEATLARTGARVDDDALISLLHANGVRSHLEASKANAKPAARFHVIGTDGAYTKWGLDPQEGQLAAGMRPGDPAYAASDQQSVLTTRAGDEPAPLIRGDYREFYRRLAAALNGGGPAPVDPSDAVYTLRILEAARQSVARHQVIALDAELRPAHLAGGV
ncbi:MAG: Gfo/Idh/MocA family oxidoreductase [Propionibacteriaceae bacterium]|nr:Gfo/Idh/MocA family oxidoreductase [Propionibacteriaceae bacterium]